MFLSANHSLCRNNPPVPPPLEEIHNTYLECLFLHYYALNQELESMYLSSHPSDT